MTKDQIIVEALKLAPEEFESLVEDLSQRVTSSELDAAQLAEIRRRIEAVDRGEMGTIPGPQMMSELRERFARR
jgi:putative addiction module component (TIGR02574 family)